MFVRAAGTVPLEWDAARAALERSVRDGGLVVESRRGQDAGNAFLMRIHPKARLKVAKLGHCYASRVKPGRGKCG